MKMLLKDVERMKRTNPTTGIDNIGIDISAKVQGSRHSLQRQDTFALPYRNVHYRNV